ncbi:glycosyltransferase family 4 protein [Patescibacteria group bacterium]|nr:glycosyltransferase family 4 protein [Patescibacteria group bacterium]
MKIGIDARLFGPKTAGGGLGRYIQQLITHLQKLDHENEYVLFLRKSNWEEFKETPNFKKVMADYHWYTLEEQIKMPQKVRAEKLDLMHYPHFNVPIMARTRFIMTIHDLILLEHPTTRATTLGPLKYKLKFAGYKKVISQGLRRAKEIIAVSEYTKKSILKYFPKTVAQKIHVIHEAASELAQEDATDPTKDMEFLSSRQIRRPFLLYVGNSYPHKNLETLTRAFRKILEAKPDLQLVLAGQENYFSKRVEKDARELGLKVPEQVNFTGFIPDKDLPKLFRQASLYVFPSLLEGFGLPPLEAMNFGLPVASSNSSCLPETLGSAAIYFNPKDIYDMAGAIIQGLDNQALRKTLINAGNLQLQKYSWEKMAKETLEIYRRAY